MAPSKPSKLMRRSSSSTSNLKQQTLGFASSKRTSSDTKGESNKPKRALSVGKSGRALSAADEWQQEEEREVAEVAGGGKEEREREKPKEKLNPGDKRWNKVYGQARAKMGNIEAVHAEGKNKVHHILRVFDTSYEYGPCIGVTRLQRWERAQALGLRPPTEIRDILLTQEGRDDPEYAQCVFYEAEKVPV